MSLRTFTVLTVTIVAAFGFAAIGAFAFSSHPRGFGTMGSSSQSAPGVMGGTGYGYGMMSRSTSTGSASLLIRHQRAHCHTWSLNGGPFKAAQRVTLDAGSSLTIINNDVMPHRLLKLTGGTVTMRNGTVMPMMSGYIAPTPGLMNHMGARTTVSFKEPGVYRFKTKAGEDFMPGIETTGEDNRLSLTVTVTA